MGMTLVGMDGLSASFDKYIDGVKKRIVDVRKQIAGELIDALLADTPVWSGRAVRSIAAGNSPNGGNMREGHPDRNDFSTDGPWLNHKNEYGDTRNMGMGQEPMRSSSESIAKGSVEDTDFSIESEVYVSSDSYMWGIIEDASYRPDARNTAVVSQIAISQIRSRFGKFLK